MILGSLGGTSSGTMGGFAIEAWMVCGDGSAYVLHDGPGWQVATLYSCYSCMMNCPSTYVSTHAAESYFCLSGVASSNFCDFATSVNVSQRLSNSPDILKHPETLLLVGVTF